MMLVYVLNLIGYSTIIGIFVETTVELQEEMIQKQNEMDDADNIMLREKINPLLTKAVNEFFITTHKIRFVTSHNIILR